MFGGKTQELNEIMDDGNAKREELLRTIDAKFKADVEDSLHSVYGVSKDIFDIVVQDIVPVLKDMQLKSQEQQEMKNLEKKIREAEEVAEVCRNCRTRSSMEGVQFQRQKSAQRNVRLDPQ